VLLKIFDFFTTILYNKYIVHYTINPLSKIKKRLEK